MDASFMFPSINNQKLIAECSRRAAIIKCVVEKKERRNGMPGIVSYGVYVPLYRLARETIAKAWGGRAGGGERSVANHDEDSLTMAVEAASSCLRGSEISDVGGLFFASTTSPYREKQCSTSISAALDLPSEIRTGDFANSLRAGTSALRSALDATAGGVDGILVTAADCRLGFPDSAQEQNFGDGAASVMVGNSGVIASLEEAHSTSDEITDVWRRDEDTFVSGWEERWVTSKGYASVMRKALSELMKAKGLSPQDFAKVVLAGPDARSHRDLVQGLGFDVKTQLQDPLISTIGNVGAAQPLLMLASALDDAKAGDRILVAGYGQGADVLVFRVTDEIDKKRGRQSVTRHISSKKMLSTYERYLTFRQLLASPPELFNVDSAATAIWRTNDSVYALRGSKCQRCGLVSFPVQRICFGCQSKDEFESVNLSSKQGRVFTYSLDHLAGGPDVPLVQTIVESDEGAARIYCLMTDCEPSEVAIDMPVEMTFRRLREARGFYNYFWKCRPIRG